MKFINNLDCSLINNHSLEMVLLNKNVLKNRARSVSPEFICRYDDECCRLYLYDLIAYIMTNNKGTGENIDDEIIILITLIQYIDEIKNKECNEFISLNKEKYEELIKKLTFGKISSKLLQLLINLYIYNEAYMENDFLIKTGIGNVSKLENRNKGLLEAKLEIKKKIIPDTVKREVEKYVLSYKKRNLRVSNRGTKVFGIRKTTGKNNAIIKYKELSNLINQKPIPNGLKKTYWIGDKKTKIKKTTGVKVRKKVKL